VGVIRSAFTALCILIPGTTFAFDKFVSLGTGSTKGTYYPVGQTLCNFVNAGRLDHKVRCVAYTTGGSVYNIQALTSGELDVGITRADLAYKAYKGLGQFAYLGANKNLRTVSNLYDTPVIVTVRKDSGIKSFDDFKGRRINKGNKGSGKRTIADQMFKILGWNDAMFSKVTKLGTTDMAEEFCDNKIDILIESIGLPAKLYDKVTQKCGGVFLDLPKDLIAKFTKKNRFFVESTLSQQLNPHAAGDIRTLSAKVVLMSLKRVSPQTINIVSKAIFSDLKSFQKSQRALGFSTHHTMLRQGIQVPFHAGAKQYYDANNLLSSGGGIPR
jgi:uncharacterized protein